MEYKYKDRIEDGYKRFYLTKKEHNKLFPKRKVKWIFKYEYYISENRIILDKFTSLRAKIFNVVMFPVVIFLEGFLNFKDIARDYKKMFNEKKYGSFSSDYVQVGCDTYDEVKKLLDSKKWK